MNRERRFGVDFDRIARVAAVSLSGVATVVSCQVLTGCGSSAPPSTVAPVSSEKSITAYSLAGTAGTIDEAGKVITVGLPQGTSVTALVATFTTTGVGVLVGSTPQVSGVTSNDFTAPVTYTVTAADASTRSYTVTVSVAKPSVLASLPETGQTTCFDLSGATIACAGSGQDGEPHEGVAWPSPRFTSNGDGSVTDLLTGLMWTQDGNAPGPASCNPAVAMSFQIALSYVACLNDKKHLGHADWRLPNRRELRSLVSYGEADVAAWLEAQGFTGVQADYYWSSTSYAPAPEHVWLVKMSDGSVTYQNREYGNKSDHLAVWPVRTGQAGAIVLPQTGQTTCSDIVGAALACAGTGQDGELQEGDGWPTPRFTDNGDQTVTDALTGLVWAQDASPPMTAACSTGHTWQGSLTYIACLDSSNYLGHDDWRLPNVNELESLSHAGQANIATWLNGQGFKNVKPQYYWASTTYVPNPSAAWVFDMLGGSVGSYGKTPVYGAWPVRAGK